MGEGAGPGPDRRLLRPVAPLAAVVCSFLALAVVVRLDPGWLRDLDRAVGLPAYLLTRGHDVMRAWWTFDASVQRPDVSRLVLLLGAAVLWWRRRGWSATWVLTSVVLSVGAAPVLKVLVDRPRPVWSDPIMVLSDPSFPSGHATAAWVLAAAVVLLCRDHEVPGRWRWPLVVVAVGAAVVVSLDRVFLGVHFPSDVLGGALLGVLVVLTCRATVRAVQRTVERHDATRLQESRRRRGVGFTAVIQVGAIAAVLVHFGGDIGRLVRAWTRGLVRPEGRGDRDHRFASPSG